MLWWTSPKLRRLIRAIEQRRPMTLFSIRAPGSMMQPSEIKLPLITAPSTRDGGRNRENNCVLGTKCDDIL